MSYQPPYQPPQPSYPNFDYYQPDVLAPARRAAIMMFVVGVVALLGAFCCVGTGALIPMMMREKPEFAQQMQSIPGVSADVMRIAIFIMGAASLVVGILYIGLGVMVRRGSKGAIITAIVLSILASLLLVLNIVVPIFSGNVSGDNAVGACVLVIPLALLVALIAMLFGAIKSSDQVAQQRYAMQYWQHAQTQAYMNPQQPQAYPYPHQQQPPQPPMNPSPPPDSGDSSGPPAQG